MLVAFSWPPHEPQWIVPSTTTGAPEIPPPACATQERVRVEAVVEVMAVSWLLNPPLPNRKLGQSPGRMCGAAG